MSKLPGLQLLLWSACLSFIPNVHAEAHKEKIRVIAFDAFPVFDPRPIAVAAEKALPGKGQALIAAWRTRQFEYTWLRALSSRYADFWTVTDQALTWAAKSLGIPLSDSDRAHLMNTYLGLKAWPDAPGALARLKKAGYRLVFLSNFTPKMLDAATKSSGLTGVIERSFSTDAVKSYKPDPRAYRIALDELKLGREEVLFVAFAGWDAAGAKAFGYPTYWVNRLRLPAEELGEKADAEGATLDDLAGYLGVANEPVSRPSGGA